MQCGKGIALGNGDSIFGNLFEGEGLSTGFAIVSKGIMIIAHIRISLRIRTANLFQAIRIFEKVYTGFILIIGERYMPPVA